MLLRNALPIAWLFLTLAASVGTAAPVPVPKATYAPPTMTFQAQSIGDFIRDVRTMLVAAAPEQPIRKFDRDFAKLFPEGKGLNLKLPLAGYLYLKPQIEQSVVVLVIPIASEKEALAFAERFRMKIDGYGKKEVFDLEHREIGKWKARLTGNEVYMALRFDENYEGSGIGDLLDKDKLVPTDRLIDPKEQCSITAKLYLQTLPEEFRSITKGSLGELVDKLERMEPTAPITTENIKLFLISAIKLFQRNLGDALRDGRDATARMTFMPKTAEFDFNLEIQPQENKPITAGYQALQSPKGRFAGIMTKNAVAGGSLTFPKPMPKDFRDAAKLVVADVVTEFNRNLPEAAKPTFEALAKLLAKTVESEKVDLGFAIHGPNKEGHYTFTGAIALDDTAALIRAVLAGAKELPKEVLPMVKLNAVKIGDVSVHQITLGERMPEEFRKVFGVKSVISLVLTPDAFYVSYGPEGLAEIERAMKLKQDTCLAFDVKANPRAIVRMLEKVRPRGRLDEDIEKLDALISLYSFNMTGGKTLKLRFGGAVFSTMALDFLFRF